jgi:hypothetical protein
LRWVSRAWTSQTATDSSICSTNDEVPGRLPTCWCTRPTATVRNTTWLTLIGPTTRHAALLRRTIDEFGVPTGNIFYDLHTAVLMREHGVGEIMTADTDFRKFAFLTVTDPVH